MRLLLLGGTSEARDLAARLVDDRDSGIEVTNSLAGRVAEPRLPVGKVRIGGFGGVEGLRAALAEYDAAGETRGVLGRGLTCSVRLQHLGVQDRRQLIGQRLHVPADRVVGESEALQRYVDVEQLDPDVQVGHGDIGLVVHLDAADP